jgi:DNA-binding NarL/FixJ family response regulator
VTAAAESVRIVLIDDHELFREGVTRLLEAEPDLKVVGAYASSEEALRHLLRDAPDLVLLDFDLGAATGISFLDDASAVGYRGKVLVVTAGLNRFETSEMIRRGISGIILKHTSPPILVQSIREVLSGKVWLSQNQLGSVIEETRSGLSDSGRRKLTSREVSILHHIFEGLTNKEIARVMQISEAAVKASLQQLFSKTGVRTRSQLVRVALERFKEDL